MRELAPIGSPSKLLFQILKFANVFTIVQAGDSYCYTPAFFSYGYLELQKFCHEYLTSCIRNQQLSTIQGTFIIFIFMYFGMNTHNSVLTCLFFVKSCPNKFLNFLHLCRCHDTGVCSEFQKSYYIPVSQWVSLLTIVKYELSFCHHQ